MNCRKCTNSSCYINNNCSTTWLEFVENYKVRKYYSSDSQVFCEGDLATGIYVICSGGVKIMMSFNNQMRIIRFAGKGKVLGHRGLGSEMVYPITAVTIENSELAFIPNEMFFKLIRKNADLSFYMLLFYADELALSERKFKLEKISSIRAKVIFGLCLLIDSFGYRDSSDRIVDCHFNIQDFSNFAGIKAEELKNVLSLLSEQNLISWNQNILSVVQENKLRSFSNEFN